MWKRNAKKEILEAIIGAAGNSWSSKPEQRTTRDNKNIMLNLFYAEMLVKCAWNRVRWQWRFGSLRPLTCWCREFSPSGLTSSFPARSSNLHSPLSQPYCTHTIHSFQNRLVNISINKRKLFWLVYGQWQNYVFY